MNAARCLISGDGELENGWNRLLGINSGLPSVSGRGVDSKPPGLRYSSGSFLTVCPCCLNDEASLLPNVFEGDCVPPVRFDPLFCVVDILLCLRDTIGLEIDVHPVARGLFLRECKHL